MPSGRADPRVWAAETGPRPVGPAAGRGERWAEPRAPGRGRATCGAIGTTLGWLWRAGRAGRAMRGERRTDPASGFDRSSTERWWLKLEIESPVRRVERRRRMSGSRTAAHNAASPRSTANCTSSHLVLSAHRNDGPLRGGGPHERTVTLVDRSAYRLVTATLPDQRKGSPHGTRTPSGGAT